jgi:hypothetical protein
MADELNALAPGANLDPWFGIAGSGDDDEQAPGNRLFEGCGKRNPETCVGGAGAQAK